MGSILLGPVDPSFRALSGRLQFTVRRHKSNKDYLSNSRLGSNKEEDQVARAGFRVRVRMQGYPFVKGYLAHKEPPPPLGLA